MSTSVSADEQSLITCLGIFLGQLPFLGLFFFETCTLQLMTQRVVCSICTLWPELHSGRCYACTCNCCSQQCNGPLPSICNASLSETNCTSLYIHVTITVVEHLQIFPIINHTLMRDNVEDDSGSIRD